MNPGRTFALCALVTLLAVIAAPPADAKSAAKETFQIAGFVGKSTTEAAIQVPVVLFNKDTGEQVGTDTTNFFGRYKFKNLPPGTYVVRVEKVFREVVLSDKDVRLDIDLSVKDGTMDYVGHAMKEAAAGTAGGTQAGAGAPAAPSDPGLVQALSGDWYHFSGSTEREVILCPDGRYFNSRESSYSGSSSDGLGNQTGSWGAAGQSSGAGRWSVQGNQQQGTITLVAKDGSREQVKYAATGERGCYSFNGNTFCYKSAANCR